MGLEPAASARSALNLPHRTARPRRAARFGSRHSDQYECSYRICVSCKDTRFFCPYFIHPFGHGCISDGAFCDFRVGRVTDYHAFPGVDGNFRTGYFQTIGNVEHANAVVMDRQMLLPNPVYLFRLILFFSLWQRYGAKAYRGSVICRNHDSDYQSYPFESKTEKPGDERPEFLEI